MHRLASAISVPAPATAQPPPPTPSAAGAQAVPQRITAAAARRLTGVLRRSLPPAHVIPLDSGYLVARRHTRHQRPEQGQRVGSARLLPGWTAELEGRYQRHLLRLHLLACTRLALPKGEPGLQAGEARFLAVLAATMAASPH